MKYDWKDAGEEWSAPWEHAILPRIRSHLPTETILEIAPGFGRWTHYLKDCCRELWIVDRIGKRIEACRQRFASDSLSTVISTTVDRFP
jgi:ubiquinone/menaquinone biosynthesis C-methylase UbiE